MRIPVVACCLVALLGPALAADDCIVLEDFARAPVGQFPPDWKVPKDAGKAVYAVESEGGRRFLHAVARDVGIQAAKEIAWEDYRRYFETADVPNPGGFAVLTDADDTHSVAIGDYADFRACRR
jgi:hypothetical protein